jgi:hypothetical protein
MSIILVSYENMFPSNGIDLVLYMLTDLSKHMVKLYVLCFFLKKNTHLKNNYMPYSHEQKGVLWTLIYYFIHLHVKWYKLKMNFDCMSINFINYGFSMDNLFVSI